MIKTGKHYKLVSRIGKFLEICAFIGVGMTFCSIPSIVANATQQVDVLNSAGFESYVQEQTKIYDAQLENQEISKEEYNNLCKGLEDKDAFIKENGNPLQLEYYNKFKEGERKSFITFGVSAVAFIALGVASTALSSLAESMEKKYDRYKNKYSDINNYQI